MGDEIISKTAKIEAAAGPRLAANVGESSVLPGVGTPGLGEVAVETTGTGSGCRRNGRADRESGSSNAGLRGQAWSWYEHRDGAGVHGQPCAIQW